ncbi:Tyrosinase [Rubripirellula lacrimiformis]|uniref:Tyrosinase n=2 Tax=Rubripirellula lacrimiformis TaxID=1930273 RepID=A0A517N5I0_9BACT|nr:Tyrosinase [Rubripirellula lacrimiformis]
MFVTPPQDGYQIYQLTSVPPAGPATTQITTVTATDSWINFEKEAPWLRGVRVLGVGDGVKEARVERRVRRNIRSLDEAEIETLRRGIDAMKSRPASDPTSWAFQANIHGTFTGSNPLFNQCQHGTDHFFSWHRLYLFHFEQILAEASGDPNLTLPYWDWTEDRALPIAFRQPADATNPLFDDSRFINQGALLPLSIVRDDLNDATAQTSFLGRFGFSSQLEGSPHGAIHVQIGGNMGSVPTAANDPIFWLHHCNIDRLWDHWLNLGGGRSNPTSLGFLDQQFPFAAADGTTVSERVGENLYSRQLGYSYDTTPAPAMPATAESPMMVAAVHPAMTHGHTPDANTDAGDADSTLPQGYQSIASTKQPPGINANAAAGSNLSAPLTLKPHRVEVPMTERARLPFNTVAPAAAEKEQLLIQVVGIEFDHSPAFTYAVYLNLPSDVNDVDRQSLYRLGTLDLFGVPKKVPEGATGTAHTHPLTRTFDATATISRLKNLGLWEDGKVEVVLLPVVSAPPPEKADEYQQSLEASAKKSQVRYREIRILAR